MARKVTITSHCLLCAQRIPPGTSAADHLTIHGMSRSAIGRVEKQHTSRSTGRGFVEEVFLFSINGVNVISRTERSEPLTAADSGLPVLGRAAGGRRARP